MKVLFISSLITDYSAYEPLGILYLAAALKKAGHECHFSHARWQDVSEEMDLFEPDVIGYSAATGTHQEYLELNRKIKGSHDVFSVIGGPHATFFPDVIHEEGVDAICIGEGEAALVELCDRMEEGKDYLDVENFWFKKPDGTVVKNPVRNYIADLDTIPSPDREMIYNKYPEHSKSKWKFFLASRGCPFKCTYCFNHYYHEIYKGKGKVLRLRSVDNLIEEVLRVKDRYYVEFVKFVDDIFLFDTAWLRRFRDRYSKEVGLPFYCCVRPNMVTREKMRYLKEAGCHSTAIAIESGNEDLRNTVLRRNMSRETIVNACQIIRESGINLFTQNMIGLPGGSLEKDFETLDLNIDCRPDYTGVTLYAPFPNTVLGEYAREQGYYDGNMNDFDCTYHVGSPLKIPDKMQVTNLQKLLAIGVEFPSVAPFIKSTLIHLPLTALYELMRKIFKGYAFKNRIFKVRYSFMESVKLAWGFLKGEGG